MLLLRFLVDRLKVGWKPRGPRVTQVMSLSARDSKPRATKNSQRLYNLEQQEKLYQSIGISKLLDSVKETTKEMENSLEQESSPEHEDSDSGKTLSGQCDASKVRRLSKDSHIMSESESEKELERDKKDSDSGKKLKKKRKKPQDEGSSSPKLGKGKKLKLQNGGASKKGKKSPQSAKTKAKKGVVNLSAPAISLPDQMMVSPEDSSVIAAHMSAYTKWLMDNNMLVSQQSLSQFSGQNQGPGTMAPPSQPSQNVQQPLGNLSQPANTIKTSGLIHELSTDESSNVDPSELEGQPPFVPKPNSAQNGPLSNSQGPSGSQQQNGELFNVCEAEKNVPLDDENSMGQAVSEQMAEMVKNFLGRSRKGAKIDELLLEFLRPKNMPYLKAPFIEDEIYRDLAAGARHFDKNCRQLQGYILAAITALTISLQSLILTGKLHPLITDAGVRVKKAIQLLAFSTKELNDRRKDALKSSVNPEYLPLLKHAKPPSHDWLLGGELHESIKKCDDSKKLSEKIMKNRKTQQTQNQQSQNNNAQSFNNNQDRFKYKNRGKKDTRPYYRNYQQQGHQNDPTLNQTVIPPQNIPYNQGFAQHQPTQLQLWQQYQQQLQHAQAVQAQVQQKQNLGFIQQNQWRDQPPQQQNYNYNQKKKN